MTEFNILLGLARRHTGALALGLLLMLATTLSNIALLAVSGWFIAAMASAGLQGVQMNYFTPAGVIRFLAMVRTAGRYGERLVTHNATFLLLSEIRIDLFRRFSAAPPVMAKSADLLARLQDDVELLDKFYLAVLLPLCVALIAVPLLLWVMAGFNANVALVCLCGLLFVGVGVPLLLNSSLKKLGESERKQASRLQSTLLDSLTGMRELAVYNQTNTQLAKLSQLRNGYILEQDKSHQARARAKSVSTLLSQLTLFGAMVILVPLSASGQLSPEKVVLLLLFVLASFEAVLMLPDAIIQWPLIKAATRRVFSEHGELPKSTHITELKNDQLLVSLSGVTTHYPKSDTPALENISLDIAKGEKVALVGASGAGKTTLVQLLCGFLSPTKGKVLLQGRPADALGDSQRFKTLGVLSQHSHLFAGSVRENMHMAAPDASSEAIWQALEKAHIAEHIRSLPAGLDTPVGRFGEPLSSGQRRRLNLAQVLLRESTLLILDEPSEGLDKVTEQTLMNDIYRSLDDRSLLLITHSPSLLANMDRVIWMEQGRIRATGTHDELLQSEADYRELVTQF